MRGESQYHQFIQRYFQATPSIFSRKERHLRKLYRIALSEYADISTTEVYARIDAEMKRKVFEEKVPNYTPNTTMPWEEDEDLLQWLTQFGKKTF